MKRTMRGGIVLKDAETRRSFSIRIYRGKYQVAAFRVEHPPGSTPGTLSIEPATYGDAVRAAFKRVEINIKSTAALYPDKPAPKESEYAVTIRGQTIQLGTELQITRADLRHVNATKEFQQ